jgi:DNA-binding transcriptional MocR family regulator
MSARTGYSPVTVHHAYVQLEAEGVLQAHPRSGFYVAERARQLAEFAPDWREIKDRQAQPISLSRAFFRVSVDWESRNLAEFGSLHLSESLFPHEELGAHCLRAVRRAMARNSGIEHSDGQMALREAVAKRIGLRGAVVRPKDVLVARSVRYCLDLCLDGTTKPGDIVLVESPSSPTLLSALQRRHLRALEIYSHPAFGVDPDQFDHLLDHNDVRACVLMPTYHFPTGVSCSEDVLLRILAKAAAKKIAIIENDTCGDLAHDPSLRRTLFELDVDDVVLQFGSFREVVGSPFGFGWILARGQQEQLRELNFFDDPIAGTGVLQQALADYMGTRHYERHMGRLRSELTSRVRRGLGLISQLFPKECAVSRPDGGFMCWMRAPGWFDAMGAAEEATKLQISYAPGQIFSVTNSYRNFLALNLSFDWDAARIEKLRRLAALLTQERP